jgi:hypothetical protein
MVGTPNAHPVRASHSIGTRRFGDYAFEVTADDRRVADHLGRLFAEFAPTAADAPDVHPVAVLTASGDTGRLVFDGELASEDPVCGQVINTLVHALTRQMVESADALGLHAGGVVRNGIGVALPASMESGKSTLTTGLVRAGFSYLTDEAVLLDWETGTVIPFPKPISLDMGSWALFPELEPQDDLPDGYKRTQWQVAPTRIRPDAMGAPCRIRYFVFPKYTQGATTRLTPLARGEATVELAKNTFRFNERARRSLDALADAARAAECFRLDVGDLDTAVALLSNLVAEAQ